MLRRTTGIFVLALGCGGSGTAPAPAPVRRVDPAGQTDSSGSALPRSRPSPFEVDLRARTPEGDDVVLKLTDAGARYGLAHGKARVALRYRLDPDAFDAVYDTMVDEAFDRIQTAPVDGELGLGTSLRLTVGPARYSANAMGRSAPTPEHAQTYERCVAAAQSLLPHGRTPTVLSIRWDASMEDHAAAIDIDLGEDFAGIQRLPGSLPNVELHVARPRELQMMLRYGSPPRSTMLTVHAGQEQGIEIRYDAENDRVIARPRGDDRG